MLPGLQRREDVVMVEMGRGEDLDGVERRVVQHLARGRVEEGRPPVRCRLSPDRLVGVAHCGDLTPGVQQVPLDVHGRDVAGTEHAQSNFFH